MCIRRGPIKTLPAHPCAERAVQQRVFDEAGERFQPLMFERERNDGAFVAMPDPSRHRRRN